MPDNNIIIAGASIVIAFVLGFDKFMSAASSIVNRMSIGRWKAWELRRARKVVASYDEEDALKDLAAQHKALQEIIRMAPKLDIVLAQVLPNSGHSLSDKVTQYGITTTRLEVKMDSVLKKVEEIDQRVRMME